LQVPVDRRPGHGELVGDLLRRVRASPISAKLDSTASSISL
jgi:hypothetical protein